MTHRAAGIVFLGALTVIFTALMMLLPRETWRLWASLCLIWFAAGFVWLVYRELSHGA